MTQGKKIFQPLTSENICRVYKLLHENKILSFPLRLDSEEKIESFVANITSSYFGQEIYKSPEEKSVAYLYFIIKDHVFTDGNKRTATLCFSIVCDLNNLNPQYEGFSLDEIAVYIEQEKSKDHQIVIRAIAMLLFPSLREANLKSSSEK